MSGAQLICRHVTRWGPFPRSGRWVNRTVHADIPAAAGASAVRSTSWFDYSRCTVYAAIYINVMTIQIAEAVVQRYDAGLFARFVR